VRAEDRVHPIHSCTATSSKDDLDQHHQQAFDNHITVEVAEKANWKATAWCNETGWQKEEAASRRPGM
jgi:hypothetical protein